MEEVADNTIVLRFDKNEALAIVNFIQKLPEKYSQYCPVAIQDLVEYLEDFANND